MVCGVLYAPDDVSFDAAGAPGGAIVGVTNDVAHDVLGVNGAHVPLIWLHTMYDGTVGGVPMKFAAGTKVMAPVDVFTVYVPDGVVIDVAAQFGATSPLPHKRTLVGTSDALPTDV
jgi:hypothetical protein